ncbi:MAG: 2-hydroxymuconate tautomerase [Pseudomonadota bacterium]
MPIVHIHLMHGRSDEQKRALVAKVTEAICDSIGTKPEAVRIILQDIMPNDYAVGGKLKIDTSP